MFHICDYRVLYLLDISLESISVHKCRNEIKKNKDALMVCVCECACAQALKNLLWISHFHDQIFIEKETDWNPERLDNLSMGHTAICSRDEIQTEFNTFLEYYTNVNYFAYYCCHLEL